MVNRSLRWLVVVCCCLVDVGDGGARAACDDFHVQKGTLAGCELGVSGV
jgi:hypothetical protein